jgi:hypothetical protein
MKKTNLFMIVALSTFLFTSCQPEKTLESKLSLDDFEAVTLGGNTVSSDLANASFVNGNATFTVDKDGVWNGGIVCSAQTDTITADYTNQYSSITGTGAPESNYISKQYGVVYGPGTFTCAKDPFGYFSIQSLMLTNSTYAYRVMQNGNAFAHKFAADDWFKVIITGYKNNVQTSPMEYYLADFRNGKSFILKTWTKVDLTALGEVDKVTFTFDSSDKGQFGINTPTYVCIDNIYFSQSYYLPLSN